MQPAPVSPPRSPRSIDDSAAARVVASLRSALVTGDLQSGERLRDQVIADDYEVSRNTARLALHQLEMEGLVTLRRHSGYSVRRLGVADVEEIFKVRRVVEPSAIAMSARVPEAALAAVGDQVVQAEDLARQRRWRDVETASLYFHQAIVDLIGSESLSNFFGIQLAQLRLAFAAIPGESGRQVHWVPRDRRIFDLLRTGNRAAAVDELNAYLDQSEIELFDALRRQS